MSKHSVLACFSSQEDKAAESEQQACCRFRDVLSSQDEFTDSSDDWYLAAEGCKNIVLQPHAFHKRTGEEAGQVEVPRIDLFNVRKYAGLRLNGHCQFWFRRCESNQEHSSGLITDRSGGIDIYDILARAFKYHRSNRHVRMC